MKTISQIFMICLLVLSNSVAQASDRSNFLPQLTRNQHVPVTTRSLLAIRQQVTSPTLSISLNTTPVTDRSSTPVSPVPYTQEYVNSLIAANMLLTNKNAEHEAQLTSLVGLNKKITSENQSLLYKTKVQQDQLNNRNNRLARLAQLTDKQDQELVEQSNKIIRLQIQITQLTISSASTESQNNNPQENIQ